MCLSSEEIRVILIRDTFQFEDLALEIFKYQYANNSIYRKYVDLLHVKASELTSIYEIPMIPIELFKTQEIKTGEWQPERIFRSSATTSANRSMHMIKDLSWYHTCIMHSLKEILPLFQSCEILALLPGYIGREDASLLEMVRYLQNEFNDRIAYQFYIDDWKGLFDKLKSANSDSLQIVFCVSFALLDFAEAYCSLQDNLVFIETGGMKGKKRETYKTEIINKVTRSFPNARLYSEYGMTEMNSQAYAIDAIRYKPSSWMHVMVNDLNDPFHYLPKLKRGQINIIDLGNIDSCCFIKTGDYGLVYDDGSFEILGRIYDEDIRGCHQLYVEQ